jgi:glycerophosphoryl diester phosphodiesterase
VLLFTIAGWGCATPSEIDHAEPAQASGREVTALSPGTETLRLIAHRGGVVDDTIAENSRAAIEEAVRRGYFMVEVDVRESADGIPVSHHDKDFVRFYGDRRRLAELRWEEIAQLAGGPGGERPLRFSEVAEACAGRLAIMLDVKDPEHPPAFFQEIEDALRHHDLLEGSYVIGTQQSREWFLGKARVGVDLERLEAAHKRDEDVARLYFLFMHGRDLDTATVRRAQELGVPVVPSINIFHYADIEEAGEDARADVERMRELGVVEFQIDSTYDEWLRL